MTLVKISRAPGSALNRELERPHPAACEPHRGSHGPSPEIAGTLIDIMLAGVPTGKRNSPPREADSTTIRQPELVEPALEGDQSTRADASMLYREADDLRVGLPGEARSKQQDSDGRDRREYASLPLSGHHVRMVSNRVKAVAPGHATCTSRTSSAPASSPM